jgi:hypothetical protein
MLQGYPMKNPEPKRFIGNDYVNYTRFELGISCVKNLHQGKITRYSILCSTSKHYKITHLSQNFS